MVSLRERRLTSTTFEGPIVRVNPTELSIKDGEFYDKVYVNGNVRCTEALPSFGDGMDFNSEYHQHLSKSVIAYN